MPNRVYTVSDVANRVRSKYGRTITERLLTQRAEARFGEQPTLSARQAVELLRSINTAFLNLSPEKKREIRRHLLHNQASGPYERKSLADIAKEVSHPRAPISPRMIKKINASIRAEVVAKGKTPKKYRLVDKSRPEAISKLRKMLAANINLGINEAAPGLGMSVERMQKVLPQFGEAFETEKRKARIVAINLLDVATDHNLLTSS